MAATGRDPSRLRRYEEATAHPLTALSLLVLPVYVAQALAGDQSGPASTTLTAARASIHIALAIDITIRTALAPKRPRFVATHKLDVAAVFIPPLRAAREIVALRTIVARPGVVAFAAFGTSVIVGCALVVYAAEHDRDGASIETVGDALWWATVTTTTVGYGDDVPITGHGRAAAVVLMLLGIAVLSVITAHIAAYFLDDQRNPNHRLDELTTRLDRIEHHLAALHDHVAGADHAALDPLPPTSLPTEAQ